MPRIKRKRIEFTLDSLNEMYQECYNDSYNFKAQLTAVLTRWSPMIKDESNVAAMGKEIVSLLNSIGKTNDQKIVLLKILKDIVMENADDKSKSTSAGDVQNSISEEAKQELMKMAEEMRKSIKPSTN